MSKEQVKHWIKNEIGDRDFQHVCLDLDDLRAEHSALVEAVREEIETLCRMIDREERLGNEFKAATLVLVVSGLKKRLPPSDEQKPRTKLSARQRGLEPRDGE